MSATVNDNYVNEKINSLDWKHSVRVATKENIDTGASFLSIDGINLVVGDKVLVKDQNTPAENGIYVYSAGGLLVRSADANELTLSPGATVYVEEGTNQKSYWSLTSLEPITIDSTAQTWENIISIPIFKKGKLSGELVTSEYGGTLDFSSIGSLRSTAGAYESMDVFSNGILLDQDDDYTVPTVSSITFGPTFRVINTDKITITIRNAASP